VSEKRIKIHHPTELPDMALSSEAIISLVGVIVAAIVAIPPIVFAIHRYTRRSKPVRGGQADESTGGGSV
jgi:hypothetical protein